MAGTFDTVSGKFVPDAIFPRYSNVIRAAAANAAASGSARHKLSASSSLLGDVVQSRQQSAIKAMSTLMISDLMAATDVGVFGVSYPREDVTRGASMHSVEWLQLLKTAVHESTKGTVCLVESGNAIAVEAICEAPPRKID